MWSRVYLLRTNQRCRTLELSVWSLVPEHQDRSQMIALVLIMKPKVGATVGPRNSIPENTNPLMIVTSGGMKHLTKVQR